MEKRMAAAGGEKRGVSSQTPHCSKATRKDKKGVGQREGRDG